MGWLWGSLLLVGAPVGSSITLLLEHHGWASEAGLHATELGLHGRLLGAVLLTVITSAERSAKTVALLLAAGAVVARLVAQRLEPGRQLLLSLDQEVNQVTSDVLVLLIEEGCSKTWRKGK